MNIENMNKYIFFLVGILYSLFNTSCSDDITEMDHKILVRAYYSMSDDPNVFYPDTGSRVFLYYGIISTELSSYRYDGDGIFTDRYDDEKRIYPDQVDTINHLGVSEITLLKQQTPLTIIQESKHYDRISATTFTDINNIDLITKNSP